VRETPELSPVRLFKIIISISTTKINLVPVMLYLFLWGNVSWLDEDSMIIFYLEG
jgi:hypothetical protein